MNKSSWPNRILYLASIFAWFIRCPFCIILSCQRRLASSQSACLDASLRWHGDNKTGSGILKKQKKALLSKRPRRGLILLILILWVCLPATQAMTPLPKGIIADDSPQGLELLSRTSRSPYFWKLEQQFVTQDNVTYCSIATSVMVLNALGIPGPTDRNYGPYHIFTQQNFFTPSVEKILPKALVQKQGATLNQIAEALSTFKVKVTVIHANESTEADFKRVATSTMKQGDGYIIVNFLRTGLGETGGGHMSPLAAYDKQTDRFLILDVSRYRYPPVWVKTHDMWKAMNTYDQDAQAYRGFIRVQKVPQ